MFFKDVLDNNSFKQLLIKEVDNKKIPHAQLFDDTNGGGLALALAFTMYLFCDKKNSNESCGKCINCYKIIKLLHPDVHFFYPTTGYTKESGSKALFLKFQKFILNNPYLGVDEWSNVIKIKSTGQITVADAIEINKIASLRSYEGGYKIFIIWHAEKMQLPAITKLLKTIEEPTQKTLFILISPRPDLLPETILSRLQLKKSKKINPNLLEEVLIQKYPDVDINIIKRNIAEQELNYTKILSSMSTDFDQDKIHAEFVSWIRLCFLSKQKKSIDDLINWCNNMAEYKNHIQLSFTECASKIFRYAFFLNYNNPLNIKLNIEKNNFNMTALSNYIHPENIHEICELLNECFYVLNHKSPASSKILFLDLSLSIGKLLYKYKEHEVR